MKTIPCLFLIAALCIALPGVAGQHNAGQLSVLSAKAQKTGTGLQIEFVIDYSHLTVASNDQLLLQPVILGEQDTLRLPYLLFPGKTRNKANLRQIRLYGEDATTFPDPYATIYPTAKEGDIFTYRQNIPFENWMYGARIEFWQDIYGCADCHRVLGDMALNRIANFPLVAFIAPEPDTLREERILLFVNFPWDQAVIRYDFSDNAVELEKIARSMQRIFNEPGAQVRQIQLTGYASPEGSYAYNSRLADRRVLAVKNYLNGKYPDQGVTFITGTVPEDWEGVRQWVQNSGLPKKGEVEDIINRVPDPDARDSYIRRLDGNVTYRRLVREAYPPLRRVEYKVHYKTDTLSVGECREIYQEHPERLTPDELYRLADSYEAGTPEFREIILATVRYYPKNTAAVNNAACIALQDEDLETARVYLLQSEDSPQKLNNQGVLLMLEGNLPEAYRYFTEAEKCGCMEAVANLHNLERTQLQN